MAGEPRPSVWVVLVHHNGVEEPATRLYCPAESSAFEVDALKDAAKAKFVQLLAHVDASQLSVSATRGGDTADPRTLVSTIAPNADSTLYIHAPPPTRAPAASTGTPDLAALLEQLQKEARLREEEKQKEARRREEEKQEEARRREDQKQGEVDRHQELVQALEKLQPKMVKEAGGSARFGPWSFTSLFSSPLSESLVTLLIGPGTRHGGGRLSLHGTTKCSDGSPQITATSSTSPFSDPDTLPLLASREVANCTLRSRRKTAL